MEIEELLSSPSTHDSNKLRDVADLSNAVDVSSQIEDLKFAYTSTVNVSNFVSVKLSSQINYHIWKAQMLCLMESQKMRGIVDDKFNTHGEKSVNTNKQYDDLLKGWIFGSLNEELLKNVVGCESAREVWTKLKFFYDPVISSRPDSTSSVSIIDPEIVTITMSQYNNNPFLSGRLRTATLNGSWWEAKTLLKEDKNAATDDIIDNGNTMLHLAVFKGQNYFLEKLLNFIEDEEQVQKKNSDGRTALHIAAMVDNKCAAKLLFNKSLGLLTMSDNDGYLPLHSAYYNKKLSTYVYLLEVYESEGLQETPRRFSDFDLQISVDFLITAIFTKQYELAWSLVTRFPELVTRNDQVLMAIAITFPTDLDFWEAFIRPSPFDVLEKIIDRKDLLYDSSNYLYKLAEQIIWETGSFKNTYYSWFLTGFVMIFLVSISVLYPIYQLIRLIILVLLFPFLMLYFLVWKVLAVVARPIKHIEKKMKEYEDAEELMCEICYLMQGVGWNHGYYNRPILEAVRQGAFKVVRMILVNSPSTINIVNEEGHNVIQLAILNRSEKVYDLIYPLLERKQFFRTMMDSSKNNLLHLAGRLAPSFVLSRTTGAALQLQRELQWREEMKKHMLPTDLVIENIYMETPEMVFTREHADLVKEGEKWMKTTAESCSITAALIVTIVFAAAITVPGGSQQETGIPLFNESIAFTVFAVSDAISLFSGATGLIVFLSILTTRFAEQDFLISLPRRLIIGLCVLFISTTSMMVAYSAVLFLVFCDQRPWMLAPIGGLACLPVTAIVTLQFPLVFDLFRSTYYPIFGKNKVTLTIESLTQTSYRHRTRAR